MAHRSLPCHWESHRLAPGLGRAVDRVSPRLATRTRPPVEYDPQRFFSSAEQVREYCPFLVFGGSATGAVRPGRYLKYRQDNPNPWGRNYSNEHTGTPHSRLYVARLRAMGMDIDHIHGASIDGSVPHLSITGTVDMSGPLPRVG